MDLSTAERLSVTQHELVLFPPNTKLFIVVPAAEGHRPRHV